MVRPWFRRRLCSGLSGDWLWKRKWPRLLAWAFSLRANPATWLRGESSFPNRFALPPQPRICDQPFAFVPARSPCVPVYLGRPGGFFAASRRSSSAAGSRGRPPLLLTQREP
jgi:hypothetical protein